MQLWFVSSTPRSKRLLTQKISFPPCMLLSFADICIQPSISTDGLSDARDGDLTGQLSIRHDCACADVHVHVQARSSEPNEEMTLGAPLNTINICQVFLSPFKIHFLDALHCNQNQSSLWQFPQEKNSITGLTSVTSEIIPSVSPKKKKKLYVWRVALTKLQIIHLLDKSQSALRKFSKVPVKATFVWKTDAEGYPRLPFKKKKTLLKFWSTGWFMVCQSPLVCHSVPLSKNHAILMSVCND